MKNVYPYKLSAFEVEIKNLKDIQELLKLRIALFKNAIEKGDVSLLGKCRYYNIGCRFVGSNVCSCQNLCSLDTSILEKSVTLKFDQDFTTTLESIRGNEIDESINCYSINDILLPRKYHMRITRGIEPLYQLDPRKEEYKTCLGDTINSFKNKFGADLTKQESENVKSWKKNPRIKIGHRWLKINKSGSPDGILTPYILKVCDIRFARNARTPSDYSMAELGLICSVYGVDNGLICTVYPKLNNHVQVFEIRYKSHNAIYEIVKDVISRMEEAQKNDDLLSLPNCPKYMNDDGQCPLINECKCDYE